MNRLTIKQTQYINRIAEVHEAELERQNTTYKRTKLSVALRIEMIEHGLRYSDDTILIQTQGEQLIGFIWARYGAHTIESTVAYSNQKMQKMNFNMGYDMDKVVMVKNLLVNDEDKHK